MESKAQAQGFLAKAKAFGLQFSKKYRESDTGDRNTNKEDILYEYPKAAI
jgi:hypothetical protein